VEVESLEDLHCAIGLQTAILYFHGHYSEAVIRQNCVRTHVILMLWKSPSHAAILIKEGLLNVRSCQGEHRKAVQYALRNVGVIGRSVLVPDHIRVVVEFCSVPPRQSAMTAAAASYVPSSGIVILIRHRGMDVSPIPIGGTAAGGERIHHLVPQHVSLRTGLVESVMVREQDELFSSACALAPVSNKNEFCTFGWSAGKSAPSM